MSGGQGKWVRCHVELPLAQLSSDTEELPLLQQRAAAQLRLSPSQLQQLRICKKSLDARDKAQLKFSYQLDAQLVAGTRGHFTPAPRPLPPLHIPQAASAARPWVIGAGPAGLFAAYALARAGLRPLIVEQGQPVEQRRRDVDLFWQDGCLRETSNIQFGEGGAGAFSDGKLTSRSKDPLGAEVLRLLVDCGADPRICYWHKAHLGSDRLPIIITNLRQLIQRLGGEFYFGCRLSGLQTQNGQLHSLSIMDADGRERETPATTMVLACGNGARQTYELLAARGVALEAKAFAVGLRVQQRQSIIDKAQYGNWAGHPLLGAADYALTWRDGEHERGCYTFCNCPGGYIVNASSEKDGLVVNGVSLAARDSGWANAAVVAQVSPGRDFGLEPLDGLLFQRRLEQAACQLGGGDLAIPVMAADSFCGVGSHCDGQEQLCSAAAREADLRELFSEEVSAGLSGALLHWEKLLPGFTHGALLAAVESRTSAPLRILRGTDRQSLNCRGLYPAGEGAGYAGGIVSSAIDGLRSALALIEQWAE